MRAKLVIAHRGASGYAPENTLKAFRTAWEMSADMVELDVQETSDGHLVCIHDFELPRTTNGEGYVGELTYREIKELDAGQGERVPLLSEVLDFAVGRIGVNIEVKALNVEKLILDLVTERELLDSVMFSSFMHNTVRVIKNLNADARTAIILSEPRDDAVRYALDFGANAINPPFETLTPELVKDAHEANLEVFPYTMNDASSMRKLLSIGVDGLITDLPDVCVKVVESFLRSQAV
ncbi:MAG: glycerophosphodiester phosphodiesterase family protein [Candidatus Thorarchaeota archaeon]